jgi:hypothetical protein
MKRVYLSFSGRYNSLNPIFPERKMRLSKHEWALSKRIIARARLTIYTDSFQLTKTPHATYHVTDS